MKSAPPMDVIIPFHDRHDLLLRCLEALSRNARTRGHVYLVDDGSPHQPHGDTRRAIEDLRLPLRRLTLERRRGFVDAVNHAWRYCDQPLTLILNNDVVVMADLVAGLTACLTADERLVAVAPASDNPTDLFQYRATPHASGLTFVPYLTAMCLAVRRKAIGAGQLFDPVYAPGYFEDFDLSCRLRADGGKLGVFEDCRVHHTGKATFRHDRSLSAYLTRNYRTFAARWGHLAS